jgi:hypothetical protein
VVVNEEGAPAEVVVVVFAPIWRGRDEHALHFTPFPLLPSFLLLNVCNPEIKKFHGLGATCLMTILYK